MLTQTHAHNTRALAHHTLSHKHTRTTHNNKSGQNLEGKMENTKAVTARLT